MSERFSLIRTSVLVALLLTVAGCGWQLQARPAVLAPELPPAPINIGAGARVYVIVVDERETKVVVHRKHDFFSRIMFSKDLAAVLRGSAEKGLSNLGFELLAAPDPSATTLAIRLVAFSYDVSRTLRSSRYEATALLLRKGASVFEKRYESAAPAVSKLQSGFGLDSADPQIDRMLEDLLAVILGDLELLRALQSGPELTPASREGSLTVVDLRFPALMVSEDDPAVELPEDVRKLFSDQLHQFLPAAGALRHDLRIVYRFVHYNPGSQFLRSFADNPLGKVLGEKGKGAITVEATFFDSEGSPLGTLRAEGTTPLPVVYGWGQVDRPPGCVFGCPFDSAVQEAADQVARHVRGNFLKPRQ
jgi:hypothetical protein